jgi:hypothetical protein
MSLADFQQIPTNATDKTKKSPTNDVCSAKYSQ